VNIEQSINFHLAVILVVKKESIANILMMAMREISDEFLCVDLVNKLNTVTRKSVTEHKARIPYAYVHLWARGH
jgi:hypothetical protein